MRPIHDTCLVDDIHSALNPTRVARVHQPQSADEPGAVIAQAARDGLPVAVCGARHAMGGQQFAAGAVLIDMRQLRRVLAFDVAAGLVEVEAGIEWPELIDYLETAAMPGGRRWSIRQKQTGADRLSLGGCLAANIHGRGLRMRPFIGDVEAFTLVEADGVLRHCSRTVNRELFALAIGGYGLFGIVASVTLRLAPRQSMRRDVTLLELERLMPAFEERIVAGHVFGDFQFAIDPDSSDFLNRGVFSCYVPVDDSAMQAGAAKELSGQDWRDLLQLAHTGKTRAFECYARSAIAAPK